MSILISTSVRISGKGEELFLFKLEQGLKRKKKDVEVSMLYRILHYGNEIRYLAQCLFDEDGPKT